MNQYTPPLPYISWDGEAHTMDVAGRVQEMVNAYLECAEWADAPEEEDWSEAEMAESARNFAWFECCAFLRLAGCQVKDWTMSQLGHDFWLTRNGHGAGFWDRDFGTEESRDKLTKLSKVFREQNIYLGADGLIYLE